MALKKSDRVHGIGKTSSPQKVTCWGGGPSRSPVLSATCWSKASGGGISRESPARWLARAPMVTSFQSTVFKAELGDAGALSSGTYFVIGLWKFEKPDSRSQAYTVNTFVMLPMR
jgi:hypothetical protein